MNIGVEEEDQTEGSKEADSEVERLAFGPVGHEGENEEEEVGCCNEHPIDVAFCGAYVVLDLCINVFLLSQNDSVGAV